MRGFSLVELMIVTAILAVVAASMGGIASVLHRTDRQTAAYVDDLGELRRALTTVERDLRGARQVFYHRVDDVFYRLDDGRLLRDDRVVARRIGHFDLRRDGDVVTVRIGLRPRAAVATREAMVTTKVMIRNPER